MDAEEIANMIRENQGGVMMIDNDCWFMTGPNGDNFRGDDLWELYEGFAILAGITIEQP